MPMRPFRVLPFGMASAAFFTRFTSRRVRSSLVRRTACAPPSISMVTTMGGPASAERRLRLASSSAARLAMGSAGRKSQRRFRSSRMAACAAGLRPEPAKAAPAEFPQRRASAFVEPALPSAVRFPAARRGACALPSGNALASSVTSFSTRRRLAAATSRNSCA